MMMIGLGGPLIELIIQKETAGRNVRQSVILEISIVGIHSRMDLRVAMFGSGSRANRCGWIPGSAQLR